MRNVKFVKSVVIIRRDLSKRIVLVTMSILLMGLTAFFVSAAVMSRGGGMRMDDAAYHQLEREYVREIRNCLTEAGYENSGVNLTWTEDAQSVRSYRIAIYHDRLQSLPKEELESLLCRVETLGFAAAGCDFNAELLRY